MDITYLFLLFDYEELSYKKKNLKLHFNWCYLNMYILPFNM